MAFCALVGLGLTTGVQPGSDALAGLRELE